MATVTIQAGENIQSVVDKNPAGTTYVLGSGTWHAQEIQAKNGDTFVGAGQGATILDGGGSAGLMAFNGGNGATNVTIKDLTVTHYAPPSNTGAIYAGTNWLVQNVEVAFTSGPENGIRVGSGTHVLNSYVHDSAGPGIGGYHADGAVIEGTDVSNNSTLHTDPDTATGISSGMKFYQCSNIVIRNDNIHDNYGIGVWFDTDNYGTLIEGNTISGNTHRGIMDEIDYGAVIRNNTIVNNGGQGILLATTQNVQIYGNKIIGVDGVKGFEQDRGSGAQGKYVTANIDVHDNYIQMSSGVTGMEGAAAKPSNLFENNHYSVGSGTFLWGTQVDVNQWKATGHDDTGTFDGSGANSYGAGTPAPAPAPAPTPVPAPAPTPAPSGGPDTLVLHVAEDAWNGDAHFTVAVDGKQVGGVLAATASHAAGQWQDITLTGNFGAGTHKVDVTFVDDTWGGSTASDRNLYVQGIEFDGHHYDGTAALNNADYGRGAQYDAHAAVLLGNGTASFTVAASAAPAPAPVPAPAPAPAPVPAPAPAPAPTPAPSGQNDTLVLHVAEDAWNGDAHFTVAVDGKQVGGVLAATASHAAGQWQDITLTGNFGAGTHKVDVTFIDDTWGGTAASDRNLYVRGIEFDGHHYDGTAAANNADYGRGAAYDPQAAVLLSNGTASFTVAASASPTPVPAPAPAPAPAPSGELDTLVLHVAEDAWNGDAHFTVAVDGKQVGGVLAATASHAAGQWQDITLTGNFGAGTHKVDVTFIDDTWGGAAASDRNLYVQGIEFNGHHYDGTAAVNNADYGRGAEYDPHAAVLLGNGTVSFNVDYFH